MNLIIPCIIGRTSRWAGGVIAVSTMAVQGYIYIRLGRTCTISIPSLVSIASVSIYVRSFMIRVGLICNLHLQNNSICLWVIVRHLIHWPDQLSLIRSTHTNSMLRCVYLAEKGQGMKFTLTRWLVVDALEPLLVPSTRRKRRMVRLRLSFTLRY